MTGLWTGSGLRLDRETCRDTFSAFPPDETLGGWGGKKEGGRGN